MQIMLLRQVLDIFIRLLTIINNGEDSLLTAEPTKSILSYTNLKFSNSKIDEAGKLSDLSKEKVPFPYDLFSLYYSPPKKNVLNSQVTKKAGH